MPPGANMVVPGASGEAEDDKRKRRTKWDDDKPKDVPDWLKDLVAPEPEPGPKPPPGIAPENFKVMKMEGVQIRALIGKGGETIRDIRSRSGADVKIDHLPQDLEGTVTIVGDVEKTEKMIREALTTKGCPLLEPGALRLGGMPGVPGAPRPAALLGLPNLSGPLPTPQGDPNDVAVPAELVGPLIGPAGCHIKEVRAKAGGTCFISVLPPAAVGAPQHVRIVGENREQARALITARLEELKKLQQRPPGPGGLTSLLGLPALAGGGVGGAAGLAGLLGGGIGGTSPGANLAGILSGLTKAKAGGPGTSAATSLVGLLGAAGATTAKAPVLSTPPGLTPPFRGGAPPGVAGALALAGGSLTAARPPPPSSGGAPLPVLQGGGSGLSGIMQQLRPLPGSTTVPRPGSA